MAGMFLLYAFLVYVDTVSDVETGSVNSLAAVGIVFVAFHVLDLVLLWGLWKLGLVLCPIMDHHF